MKVQRMAHLAIMMFFFLRNKPFYLMIQALTRHRADTSAKEKNDKCAKTFKPIHSFVSVTFFEKLSFMYWNYVIAGCVD